MSARLSDSYLVDLSLNREAVPDFSQYPFTVPAVAALSTLKFHPKVTYIIGENGLGKSTLLEAIAIQLGLNPEGGSRNFAFDTRPSHSSLAQCINLAKGPRHPRDAFFLRAESFFNLATEIEHLDASPGGPPIISYYGGRSLHEQSHGESFFSLFVHRFGGQAIYLLDEPEAALSPMRQMAFLAIMHDLIAKDSQFVIATHSPIIMAYPDALIYELSEAGIRTTPYQETQHYAISRGFLVNPERMLRELLNCPGAG